MRPLKTPVNCSSAQAGLGYPPEGALNAWLPTGCPAKTTIRLRGYADTVYKEICATARFYMTYEKMDNISLRRYF